MAQQTIQTFNGVGNREDFTCNAIGGVVKTLFSSVTQKSRQGVMVKNHHASDSILYKVMNMADSLPAITTTSNDGEIPADGKPVFIACDRGCKICYISETANTPQGTAVEVF